MSTPIALTIAGSDSGGGAGIQADLKTFAALGVYGASVVTALTAQNTQGVSAIHDVPADFVLAQLDAVLSDLHVDAVKIGMISQPAVAQAVAAGLEKHAPKQDRAGSRDGGELGRPAAGARGGGRPAPAADPARAAADAESAGSRGPARWRRSRATKPRCAIKPSGCWRSGPRAVLIKGGHGKGAESVDFLVEADAAVRLAADRIATANTHGTGCTLSAAVAAGLARGLDLAAAVRQAKAYVTAAIAAAGRLAVGSGHGPLHHFHALW